MRRQQCKTRKTHQAKLCFSHLPALSSFYTFLHDALHLFTGLISKHYVCCLFAESISPLPSPPTPHYTKCSALRSLLGVSHCLHPLESLGFQPARVDWVIIFLENTAPKRVPSSVIYLVPPEMHEIWRGKEGLFPENIQLFHSTTAIKNT